MGHSWKLAARTGWGSLGLWLPQLPIPLLHRIALGSTLHDLRLLRRHLLRLGQSRRIGFNDIRLAEHAQIMLRLIMPRIVGHDYPFLDNSGTNVRIPARVPCLGPAVPTVLAHVHIIVAVE